MTMRPPIVSTHLLIAALLLLSACAGPRREGIGDAGDLTLLMSATQITVQDKRPTTGENAKAEPPLSQSDRGRMTREVSRRFAGGGPAVDVNIDVVNADEALSPGPEGTSASATATVVVTVRDTATGKQLSQQTSAPTGAQGLAGTSEAASAVFQKALVAALLDGLRRVRDTKAKETGAPAATFQHFPGTEPQAP